MKRLLGLDLSERNVHVWRVFLPDLEMWRKSMEPILSGQEISFSERFRDPVKKTRYILRNGILRSLIHKYTTTPPKNIEFCRTKFGKPFLKNQTPSGLIRFNVSYSHDRLLLVFSREYFVGIDIEYKKREFPVIDIANRFFTSTEANLIKVGNETAQTDLFFRIWVLKEAYTKAVGKGLFLPLNSFDVPIDLLALRNNASGREHVLLGHINHEWFFYDIPVNPEYCGCLVLNSPSAIIRTFDLNSLDMLKD